MSASNTKSGHVGKKIRSIREMRGIKQDHLASLIGETQQNISKIERSEDADGDKLQRIAEALGVTTSIIKDFDEDVVLGATNFFNPCIQENAQHSNVVVNQFNPLEKLIELYERMLASEYKKNELLEALLRSKNGVE